MKIEQSSDFLMITFEEEDLTQVNKNGEYLYRKVENELKKLDGASHSNTDKCWFVPGRHGEAVQKIYDKYFKDENQLGLFN